MKIRKANMADAKGVAKVQVDSWKTTYKNIVPDEYLKKMTYERREHKWKDIISNQTVFVAETMNGEIVGFSNGGIKRTDSYTGYKGELYAIYLLEEHQRKGLGKLLLEAIIEALINNNIYSMIVLVLERNNSRMFYESLGGKRLDTVVIDISGEKLNEIVYGWEDIRVIC